MRSLSGKGFKILLDMIASLTRQLRVAEVPYTFRTRLPARASSTRLVLWEFGMLLAEKLFGRYMPVRFYRFAAVGGAGVLRAHGDAVGVAHRDRPELSPDAQAVATVLAMVFNFWLNNVLTYRDRRLQRLEMDEGLVSLHVRVQCRRGRERRHRLISVRVANRSGWLAALSGCGRRSVELRDHADLHLGTRSGR